MDNKQQKKIGSIKRHIREHPKILRLFIILSSTSFAAFLINITGILNVLTKIISLLEDLFANYTIILIVTIISIVIVIAICMCSYLNYKKEILKLDNQTFIAVLNNRINSSSFTIKRKNVEITYNIIDQQCDNKKIIPFSKKRVGDK